MKDVRLRLLNEIGVSLVIDVGANAGQYAAGLRKDGYRGQIISFEPMQDAYTSLQRAAAGDPCWQTQQLGLAETCGRATLNVSANSYSSSLLTISSTCVDAAPDAAFVRAEEVDVATLDSLDVPGSPILLKIDVQGYEARVLRGARRLLSRVALVELELSLVPLYDSQELASAMCALLRELAFVPVAFDVAFSHPRTGEILQLDGLFRRV